MYRLIKKHANKKITLYHGTSSLFFEDIINNGLLPEAFTGNTMFLYNDYKRSGVPRHINAVYLTNNISEAKKFANNSAEKKGGIPIVFKVKVNTDALIWDEYALYKNYSRFDLGKKNVDKVKWEKKPKKELWEQSLNINYNCAHYGKINPENIMSILLNERFYDIDKSKKIIKSYNKTNVHEQEINNEYGKIIDFVFDIVDICSFQVTFIDRDIYMYNLKLYGKTNIFEKQAISLKIMEKIKEKINEYGIDLILEDNFSKIGLDVSKSSFNYIFISHKIKNKENLIKNLEYKIKEQKNKFEIFKKIITNQATNKEFDFVYKYSVDFIGDFYDFCSKYFNLNENKIISILENIKEKYKGSYEKIEAEINYLKFKNLKNQ